MKFTSYVRLDPNVKLIFGLKGVKLKVHTNAVKFFQKATWFPLGGLCWQTDQTLNILVSHTTFSPGLEINFIVKQENCFRLSSNSNNNNNNN